MTIEATSALQREGSIPVIQPPLQRDTAYHRKGLTIEITRTYFDADSNASDAYDPETTVRIFVALSASGTIDKPFRHSQIEQSGYLNVTGVTPSDTVLVLNGSITRSVESEFQSGWRAPVVRTYSGAHTWAVVNVAIGRDRLLYPYPLSGTIFGTAEFTRTHTNPNHTRTVTVRSDYAVEFDSTRFAPIGFGAGGSLRFWIDLLLGTTCRERP
ncbi:MAG: hypothetical protein FJY67_06185 [Calditrichaeota bacterium]|nr:hypothetical protein [Calditrichota bacterium]